MHFILLSAGVFLFASNHSGKQVSYLGAVCFLLVLLLVFARQVQRNGWPRTGYSSLLRQDLPEVSL